MEEKILDILAEICEDDVVKEDTEINMVEEGLIDSLGFIQLLFELEDQLGIVIAPTEYTKDQMSTPAKVIAVAKEKSRQA